MEYFTTEKGKLKIIHEGYVYVKQKELKNGVTSFECEHRRNKRECKAKLKVRVKEIEIVDKLHEHTHAPDVTHSEVSGTLDNIRKRARESEDTSQQIIAKTCANIRSETAANLPPIHHIKRNIRNRRKYPADIYHLPKNAAELILTRDNTKTDDGQEFLIHDSGRDDENRMLFFSTDANLGILSKSPHWFLDGTFKTVPNIFTQMYVIHGLVNNSVIPLVYILLQNKQQSSYEYLFQELKSLQPNLSPLSMMVDFEKGAINALQLHFPDTEIKSCFFHFSQCIYRKIQSCGFQKRYQEDGEFSTAMRMLLAIAFVPMSDVRLAFDELCGILPPETYVVQDYFEDTFIGRITRRGQERQPIFSPEIWNMYNRTMEELPRTNNTVEGWHRGFSSNVGCCHPNIFKFLKYLMREQAVQCVRMTQEVAGIAREPPRKKYRDTTKRIMSLVKKYDPTDLMSYLRGISYNLKY